MKTLLYSLFIALLFSACSLMDLNDNLNKADTLSHVDITIDIQSQEGARIIIALANMDNSTLVDYRVVKKKNKTSFVMVPGKYKVYAYEDLDKNYKYSHNERVSSTDIFTLTSAVDGKINMTLTDFKVPTPNEIPEIDKIIKNFKLEITNSSINNGSIIPVNSDIYNKINIQKGLWEPYTFVFEVPFGIFIEKKYDPSKKVVLFIHGVSGAPSNFEYLVNNLDKSKYQAMYVYYPSGVSLYKSSEYLARVLNELRDRFNFDDISVVSHSMGGLVSRNMINILSKDNYNYIDTFITISSPLSGDKQANDGVEYSPVVMPVWRDMAYNSEFSSQLYSTPLSKKINYYLIFGVKSDSNDDGVVSIPSQLRMEAQKEAKTIRGYNEDHTSILNSKEVSEYIYGILDANY